MAEIDAADGRPARDRLPAAAAVRFREPVQASFRWSPDELAELVHAVETFDDEGSDWQRGGIGQSLWSIMVVDPELLAKLPSAIRTAVEC